MAQVSASSSLDISATPDAVLTAVSDYETVRPRILSDHYRDYRVEKGGQGAGTVAGWTLQATEKRQRDVLATVTVDGSTVTERDANSSMVTTWSVAPSGQGSTVTTTTQWTGAGGIGGFFEKTFAPLGLKKIQAEVLQKLARELE
ncbi:SRPBCC family protein [Actinomycetes bacterium M1A6_2h]